MSVRVFSVLVVNCSGGGLTTGWSPAHGVYQLSIRSLRLLATLNENRPERLIRMWKYTHFLVTSSVAPVLFTELEYSAPLIWKFANSTILSHFSLPPVLTSNLTKVHINSILLSPTLPRSQPLLQRFRQQNIRKLLFPDVLHLHPITTSWISLYRVFQKSFTMAFQMLLCGECYENVCTWRHTNYSSFKLLNDG
jgi:hypothetical protein